ncbi:MAG: VOC family protein [Herpetosiphonaceae bacterium]|nr:VOC family protein [Herpetosiphonaceae bacterium]
MTTHAQFAPTTSIHPATTVGLLALTVADLSCSLAYYTDALGFAILDQTAETATLGAAGTPLLLLGSLAGARPWPRGGTSYTGLYHFAILLPTRADLGRWLRHWMDLRMPLPGQGDHLVSEALYLEDPDGHGIEIYRDRPRSEWHWINGKVQMGADSVDLRGLVADAEREGRPWQGLPAGTRLGHIHLQVGDIPQAAAFYRDLLGFDIVAQMPSALFVSAGGYHHHIGMNTWHSRGATPGPAGTVGLRFFTIDLPDEAARQTVIARVAAAGLPYTETPHAVLVQDPWQNTILLQIGSASDTETAARLATAAAGTIS